MGPLPIIDVHGAGAGADAADDAVRLAPQLDRACSEYGFFLVTGHGLSAGLDAVFALARQFFALPQEVKERVPRSSSFGFVPRRGQALDPERPAGVTEYLDLSLAPDFGAAVTGDSPPVPGFAPALARYQADALGLAAVLLRGLASALDLEVDYFARRMTAPECKLRLLHYWPGGDGPGASPPVPTEPHTDYGALTLLATDGVPGLEIRQGGSWRAVPVPPGALVVNLGDMLARWTNLRYTSTQHRVVSGPDHRYSVPFFVNPDPGTEVACLPSCVSEADPCRYEPVTASAFLAGRIDGAIPEPYAGAD